jgi:NAD(P)-dependent dehydrogenase (short-subunit alcohol dehydrogenase family)
MSGSGARYPDLADLPVLVTGGGSGIGAAIVAAFAEHGARVCFLEISADAARVTSSELAGARHPPLHRIVDLRDIPATRAAIAGLAEICGPFRALVNNAGDDGRHAWDAVTPELWDDRFAVNLRHQFFVAQALAPSMRDAGGGAIVNLGSISWMFGAPGLIAYTTAKSAVEGLTKSLARELGPDRIRVNSIAPGMIWTEKQIARARESDPLKLQRYLERQCLKEALKPGDVARLALWLASAEARLCSGQTFILDGGVV